LLGRMKAVITTPSTVALDAARRNLQVAVVAHEMDIDNYRPLFQIRNAADWTTFVAEALNESLKQEQISLSEHYVDRMILRGDASVRILDDLFSPA